MGGTIVNTLGKEPSNIGVPAVDVIVINFDVGEGFSEPILLAGRKVVSLQANSALAVTNITMQGANFTSDTTRDASNQVDGFTPPLAADFNDLYDESDTLAVITGTTGQRIWSCPNVGFPLWVRFNLSAPQTVTMHLAAKG